MSATPSYPCPPTCQCPFACRADHENDDEPSNTEIEEDQPCAP